MVYTLARPVLRTEDARRRPLKLLARIAEFYTEAYGADVRLHRGADAQSRRIPATETPPPGSATRAGRSRSWPNPSRGAGASRKSPITIEGRNCTMFMTAMRYFGHRGPPGHGHRHRHRADLDRDGFRRNGIRQGGQHQPDWHRNECLWIAKSVTRYCRENIRHPRMTAKFRGRQAWKGRKSGEVRRQDSIEEAQPWLALEISRRTYFRHQGAPAVTITELAPWEEAGDLQARPGTTGKSDKGVSDTSSPSSTGGI